MLRDGDTGYHIRVGEFILQNRVIPREDIFSYITPILPWTTHEWLSEVVMAGIHQMAGLTGVVVFFAVLLSLTYAILFRFLHAKSNLWIAVGLTLFVFMASSVHMLARPHLFSFFFVMLSVIMLDSFQTQGKKYVYFMVPLMLVWVNLHGGFVLGFMFLGVYLAGNAYQVLREKSKGKKPKLQKIEVLGMTTLACVAIAGLNPLGYSILLFPFKTISNQFLMNNVLEFMSPNFHEGLYFEGLLLTFILILALSKKPLQVTELLLVLLLTHMALYSVRHIPIFSIGVAPILARQLYELIKPKEDFIKPKGFLSVWSAAAILLVGLLGLSGFVRYDFQKTAPMDAIEFLKKQKIEGRVYNQDEIGDYMIYYLWPQYRVFIDGRSDMYGAEIIQDYLKIQQLKSGWKEVFESYDFRWTFDFGSSALSTYLRDNPNWKLVFKGKSADIFVKKT